VPIKVNIVLDDDVKRELDHLVEGGSRSRIINQALRKELLQMRRREVSASLKRLRKRTQPVATGEIVELLRRDRKL